MQNEHLEEDPSKKWTVHLRRGQQIKKIIPLQVSTTFQLNAA